MLHYSHTPALPLFPLGICASPLTFHFMFFCEFFFICFFFFTLSLFAICCVFLSPCWCFALQCPLRTLSFFCCCCWRVEQENQTGFTHMLKSWPLMGCRPRVQGNQPSADCYDVCHITLVAWSSDDIMVLVVCLLKYLISSTGRLNGKFISFIVVACGEM